MAVRLNLRHQDMIREKIKGSQLVNVLSNHALGKQELGSTQVTAALGLLKKVIPDLKATDHTNDGDKFEFPTTIDVNIVKPEKRSDPTDA